MPRDATAAPPRPPAKERIGDRIARLRRERHISQTELGHRIGVKQRMVSSYETHRIRIPAEMLLKIADVLQTSVYELLGRVPAPKKAKNPKLWKLLQEIEALPAREQRPILHTLENFLKGAQSG